MSALERALFRIKMSIPKQILKETFERKTRRFSATSVEANILNMVIRPRVLVDCNIYGGETAILPVQQAKILERDNFRTVYLFPKEATNGRTIISVLNMTYLPMTGGINSAQYPSNNFLTNAVANAGARAMASQDMIPMVSTSKVELVGENIVMVTDGTLNNATRHQYLKCIVENDENLNNFNIRSYPTFEKLCLLAVKAFIYNELIIDIDEAYLDGGKELGRFKEEVEKYSEAEDQYQLFLEEEFAQVAFMNDRPAYEKFIRIMVNPAL